MLALAREATITEDSANTCPVLTDVSLRCDGSTHMAAPDIRPRPPVVPCPLRRYRTERQRLAAALALCGYAEDRDAEKAPIGVTLFRLIDQNREVDGLRAALKAAKGMPPRTRIELDPSQRDPMGIVLAVEVDNWRGHFALTGTVGTAKTHILLAMYFSRLWEGQSAWWIPANDLRQVAKDRNSVREQEQEAADLQLRTWQARKLLIIDDLGDRLSDPRARDPGSTQVSALLTDLLNGTSAQVWWSSNLDADKLREHADVGPRAVSRLFADHRGVACKVVSIGGQDQRQHAMRGGE